MTIHEINPGNLTEQIPAKRKQDGVMLHIRLTPKSGGKPALKAFVTAPPEHGKANTALVTLVAEWLRVPRSTVRMVAGQKSRLKSVAANGNPDELIEKLTMPL